MTEQVSGQPAGTGPVPVDLGPDDIDDVLEDLPGGQSVSEATRRLRQQLHDARRRGVQLLPAAPVTEAFDDIFHASPVLVRQPPSRQPRRFLALCKRDGTGSTGVGVVAEGCQFSDGATAWRRLKGDNGEAGWEFYDTPGTGAFLSAHQAAVVIEVVWIDPADEPN